MAESHYADWEVKVFAVERHGDCQRSAGLRGPNWCAPHDCYWPSGQSYCNRFVDLLDGTEAVLKAFAPGIAARALREAADRYLGFTRPDSGLIPKEWANGFMEAIDGVAKDLSKHADEIEEARRG